MLELTARAADGRGGVAGGGGHTEAVLILRRSEQRVERVLDLREIDAVLRALRAGDARNDRADIEIDVLGVIDAAGLRDAVEALSLVIFLHQLDVRLVAARLAEIVERLIVDREEAHRGAVFRGHVGDRGAIGEREGLGAFAVELDELADDLGLAEDFREAKGEVGRRDALAEAAGEINTDDFRRLEVDRLAEHAGFGFDAAHAPAHDADAVDHRGVGVGADEGVRVEHAVLLEDQLGEVLEVDLVHDADRRRDDAEGLERLHAPLEEFVALGVATEFLAQVLEEGGGGAGAVDLHGVVDDEVDGDERFDHGGVLAELGDGFAHGGEVDKERHPGEVLQHDARDDERDLGVDGLRGVPGGERLHVVLGDRDPVAITQYGFEDEADGDRQARDLAEAGLLEGGHGIDQPGLAAGGEGAEGFEGVLEGHGGVWDERGCQAAGGRAGSQKQRRRSGQSDNEMPNKCWKNRRFCENWRCVGRNRPSLSRKRTQRWHDR